MSFVKSTTMPIPYETGFPEDDRFELKHKGKTLSRALEVAEGPVVIAVDGPWGCGKSFFLRAWSKDHHLNADVIYFDAFEHDYLDDPLISLVQAISPKVEKSASDKLVQGAKKIGPLIGKIAVSYATFGAIKEFGDLGDIAATEVAGDAKAALDRLWKIETGRHEAMGIFKLSLGALVEESSNDMLVIIIDELDRCRPDYALQLLETIKHFFAVDGVHFVLGTNLNQLSNSVRARYGATSDAEKYLQRFVHATFQLSSEAKGRPRAKNKVAEYFRTLDHAEEFQDVYDTLLILPHTVDCSFRDLERLYTLCKVVDPRGDSIDRKMVDALCIIKACKPIWIDELIEKRLELNQLADFFGLQTLDLKRSGHISDMGISCLPIIAVLTGSLDADQLPNNFRDQMKSKLKDGAAEYLSALARFELQSFKLL